MYAAAIVCAFLWLFGPSCTNSDNFALLGGTLKTMQRAACDDEMVSLACPTSTTISIQVAQFGKAVTQGICTSQDSNNQAIDVEVAGAENCKWPNSMQYSLLQTVVEACQKKPSCKFSPKPKPGLVDPCPFTRKFVEVAYRCRPYEFRSRTACEDEVIQLSCNPFRRVAVFDAQYGRLELESVTCPQTSVRGETCFAQHAAETVMQICHGKRRCTIAASSKIFGTPCKPETRAYLKVVYACVPLGVLSEKYESATEKDEMNGNGDRNDSEESFDESGEAGEKWSETNVISPVADPALQPLPESDEDATPPPKTDLPTLLHPPEKKTPETYSSKTTLFTYIGIGLAVFAFLIILLIGVRCYIIRKTSRDSKTGDMFTTEAPNVFNDAVSDIDNDIDVSHISGTFYDPIHPDMILYRDVAGTKGTLRAMRPLSTIYPCAGASMYGNVDFVPPSREIPSRFSKDEDVNHEVMTSPKSLDRTYSSSQFYYG